MRHGAHARPSAGARAAPCAHLRDEVGAQRGAHRRLVDRPHRRRVRRPAQQLGAQVGRCARIGAEDSVNGSIVRLGAKARPIDGSAAATGREPRAPVQRDAKCAAGGHGERDEHAARGGERADERDECDDVGHAPRHVPGHHNVAVRVRRKHRPGVQNGRGHFALPGACSELGGRIRLRRCWAPTRAIDKRRQQRRACGWRRDSHH